MPEKSPLGYFSCFHTMEYATTHLSYLLVTSLLIKKVPMEIESYISLGGTIILLALFAQKYIFGQRYNECAPFILTEPAIKKELKEYNSIVR